MQSRNAYVMSGGAFRSRHGEDAACAGGNGSAGGGVVYRGGIGGSGFSIQLHRPCKDATMDLFLCS